MTANDLIAAFETLADAPDGVKRLRELVLQLAVRGKLVPQDPTEKRIAPSTNPPSAGEAPFDLPETWRWLRLPEVADYAVGKTPATKEPRFWGAREIPWVSIGDMPDGGVVTTTTRTVSAAAANEVFRRPPAKAGTLLMSFKLTIGKMAVLGVDAYHNEAIISITPNPRATRDYLLRVLPMMALGGESKDAIMGATLNGQSLARILIPLPPLAEQHRIVARVDELMGLLDRLEAARTARDDVRRAARDAALAALRDAEDTDAVEAAWGRIAGKMDALFAEPEDVGPLRDVILDLAVGGRLVPQVPIDDPAERLVARSTAEMQRRHMAGLTRIGEDPGGYDRTEPLPGGWCWCSLQRLVQFIDYRGNTPTKVSSGVRLITAKNIRRGFINRQPEEFVTEETYREWMTRGFPQPGDVLFTTEAPMGNAALVDVEGPFALAQRTINLQPYAGVSGAFLVSLFLSPWFQAELTKRATGMTATGIKAAKLRQIRVPVPPLAEQHRIVAKVDALMSICGGLEARLTTARDLHGQFAAAAVHHLDV